MGASEAREIAKQFAVAIKSEYRPQSVYLFGSYAKGEADEKSDIDVAVIVANIDGDYLEKWGKLFGYSWNISDKIEPHLLLAGHDNMLLDEIYATGEKIL